MTRPVWDGSGFVPRKMMNLSSSFDHRVVDGAPMARALADLEAILAGPIADELAGLARRASAA